MGAGLNKVILIGNLGKDPVGRDLEGGNLVATFTLATSEFTKDKFGNRDEKTEWHNIVIWGKLAEYAIKNLKKGNTIMVEGKIRTRHWEDKNEMKHYVTEIIGDHVINLSGAKKDPAGGNDLSNRINLNNSNQQNPSPEVGNFGINDGTGDLS